ncbi:hypothetical protein AcW1_001871 [Taiwanofungus camphoratus]|nr:hypothetical protein AcW1_001871 [Antrodia cinnamomea]
MSRSSSSTWRQNSGPHRRTSPSYDVSPTTGASLDAEGSGGLNLETRSESKQSIFLQSYKVKERLRILPQVLKAAAEAQDLSRAPDDHERLSQSYSCDPVTA